MGNPLYLIPLLITGLSGNPELGTMASYLISAVDQEASNSKVEQGVEQLVTMHFKNGLTHLQASELVSPNEKRYEVRQARDEFISASNVESDQLRIARADLYISGTSKLLGDHKMVLIWAEKAYVDLSRAESLAWRMLIADKDTPLKITPMSLGTINLYPMCDSTRQGEMEYFTNLYKYYRDIVLDPLRFGSRGIQARQAKLKEIYAYKVPLAAFLRQSGSSIRELTYPVTVPLANFQLGASVAVRLSDEECPNRRSAHN